MNHDNPDDPAFRPVRARLVSGKRKRGRKSKYDPDYCDQLVEHMTQGYSFESFAGVIGVNRDTLYEWTTKHRDFSDAKKRATDAGLLFWERLGMAGMMGKIPDFSTGMWIFSMKARFKWQDNHDEQGDTGTKEFEAAFAEAAKALANKRKAVKGGQE